MQPLGPALLHIAIDKMFFVRSCNNYDESVGQNRIKSALHSTEPANYWGSYTARWKEIVEIEIIKRPDQWLQQHYEEFAKGIRNGYKRIVLAIYIINTDKVSIMQ